MSTYRLASFIAAAALVLGAGRAFAQSGTGGSTSSFTNDDFQILIQDGDENHTTIAEADLATPKHGFNVARCQCQSPFRIRVILTASGLAKPITSSMRVKVGIGTDCTSNTLGFQDRTNCTVLQEDTMTALKLSGINVDTNATVFSTLGADTSQCTSDSTGTVTIFVGVFTSASGQFADSSASRSVLIDLQPPEPPDVTSVRGGQGALVVDWEGVDQTAVNDLLGYQVFCTRGADLQVFANTDGNLSFFGQLDYKSPRMLTGGTCTGTPRDPASPVTLADVQALDPAIACHNRISVGTTSARITGLENGIVYAVAVAAVDKYGNASPIVGQFQTGSPVQTTDFWNGYRQAGNSSAPDGVTDGGFCSLGQGASGGTALAATLVAGLALAMVIRRRRR